MLRINTLIVEDNADTRKIIELGIVKYNEASTDSEILIAGEADSFESACAITINQDKNEPIRLVFLDLTLLGDKTGIDFIKKYPKLGYIVISRNPEALNEIARNAPSPTIHYYIHKISEGAFDINDIVLALQKFVREKRVDFYAKTIHHGKKIVILKDVALISKKPMKIAEFDGRYTITKCKDCIWADDSHFFISNKIDSNLSHKNCLWKQDLNSSKSYLSIKHIMIDCDLNPNQFILVDQSLILNLDYLDHIDGNNLFIRIVNSLGNITAIIQGDASLIKDNQEKIVNRNRNTF